MFKFFKKIIMLGSLILGLLLLSGCAVDPITGERTLNFYSEKQEIELGRSYHQRIIEEYGVYEDAELTKYVQDMVTQLGDVSHRPHLNYKLTVLDTPQVNAFATAGGWVYVCRGILPYFNSEDELAAVMAHEIGHVTAQHIVKRMSWTQSITAGVFLGAYIFGGDDKQKRSDIFMAGTIASSLTLLSYSRENEMEADRLAIEYATKAGWSPKGMGRVTDMFMRFSQGSNPLLSILSTHPTSDLRRKQARIEVRKWRDKGFDANNLIVADYLKKIDGIMVGRNPKRGIEIANTYYNTSVNITAKIPADHKLSLDVAGYLLAMQGDEGITYVSLIADKNSTEKKIVSDFEKSIGLKHSQVSRTSFLNKSGNSYYYLGKKADKIVQLTNSIIPAQQGGMYQVITQQQLTTENITTTYPQSILRIFNNLDPANAAKIEPKSLKIHTTKPTDTWKSLATEHFTKADAERLAWLNGKEKDEALPALVKLQLF